MALTREKVIDAAYAALRERGLGGLSMRGVAQDLGVRPGALYYHVASKQELLVAVAERVLLDGGRPIPTTDPRQAAARLREALLRVRDGAEVVSFAQAFRPDALAPLPGLHRHFGARFPPLEARWATQTLIHYVLGFVAEEQNRAELVRAGIVAEEPNEVGTGDGFDFGMEAILRGLTRIPSGVRGARR